MSASSSEPVGGPAEEARRLVEALGDWASTRVGSADEHIATGSLECQVCPVCQLIAAMRGDRSEALARLGEAWKAFLGVLTAHSPPPTPSPATEGDTPATPEPPIRPVQSIDVQ
ncbi:MAG: hypothetical protein WKF51_02880 [Geodermatophilaceae bacterium]